MSEAYGDKKIISTGPVYESMKIDGNKIILSFKGSGGLVSKGSDELKYFAIAGVDKKFVWAKAKISDNRIIVWNDDVSSDDHTNKGLPFNTNT